MGRESEPMFVPSEMDRDEMAFLLIFFVLRANR